jgi:short-subunit dehydrogenase
MHPLARSDCNLAMSEVRYQFDVNLFGMGRLMQLFTPYMRRPRAGKIVNIAWMGGKIYTPLGACGRRPV